MPESTWAWTAKALASGPQPSGDLNVCAAVMGHLYGERCGEDPYTYRAVQNQKANTEEPGPKRRDFLYDTASIESKGPKNRLRQSLEATGIHLALRHGAGSN